tara:strand:+ start:72 stop:515 length:444 start_codon:yes stop_codon:yes gene_type:complete
MSDNLGIPAQPNLTSSSVAPTIPSSTMDSSSDGSISKDNIILGIVVLVGLVAVGVAIYLIFFDESDDSDDSTTASPPASPPASTPDTPASTPDPPASTPDPSASTPDSGDSTEPFVNYKYDHEPGRPDMNDTSEVNSLLPGYFKKLF